MRKTIFAILCILLFCNHDMYLKLDTYFLQPNQSSRIQLFNGTFDKSENVIERDRMLDASLVGNGKRIQVDNNQWTEKDSITILNFKTGNAGTWVAGVSTKARNIEMDAAAFNKYLKHDGIKDMLSERAENKTLDQDAVEKYSKHVKLIFQVGDKKTEDWKTVLGYSIEFVPVQNPYDVHTGDNLQIKLLRNGLPLANQLVYVDYKPSNNGHHHNTSENHSHDEDTHTHKGNEDHRHTTGQELRTNNYGVVSVKLKGDGIWYVRTIHLVNSDEEGLTHESNWATLTFETTHQYDDTDHTHKHKKKEGIPMYVLILGSMVIIGILFFLFKNKK